MKIGEIIRKLLNDGAVTFQDCVDMLLDDEYLAKAGIADSEYLEDTQAFFTDIIVRGACITRCDDEGTVENYCFYFNDEGNLVSDHDMRCLNGDGERYLCDEWNNEPCTLEEIIDIWSLGNGDEWHKGWNNVDCNL